MTDNSNFVENREKPLPFFDRNTTKIPNLEFPLENEIITNSEQIKQSLQINYPRIIQIYKGNLEKVIQEINLWRKSIDLENLTMPPIIFVDSQEQFNARIFENVQYNTQTRKTSIFGKRFEVNIQNLIFDNFRTIYHIIAHEMIHFSDNHYIYSHKYKKRFVGGLSFGQLTQKGSETPYLEEKITLSPVEIEEIKDYLGLIGANLVESRQSEFLSLVLTKRQEIGFQAVRDIENKLSRQALKFLNHFVSVNPNKSGFEVWQYLNQSDFYSEKMENGNFVYLLPGLLDKANQENYLNEGLCDFLGNLITDKILGKLPEELENTKEIGYPEYFWAIQNFWNSCDQIQQTEFLNAVLLAKFKYNSIAPIYKFFQKFFASSNNPNFAKRFSIRDIFYLNIFETAKACNSNSAKNQI